MGTKIRTCGEDASYAGWSDPATIDAKGNLLFEDGLSGVEECPVRALRSVPSVSVVAWRMPLAGLATLDDGSTE